MRETDKSDDLCLLLFAEALILELRYRAEVHSILAANWSTSDACVGQWRGVNCSDGRVTSLFLPSLDLHGSLDSLSLLDQLHVLDLHGNWLNGTLLPLISTLRNLQFIYLSGNDLFGEIPAAIGRLSRLLRIDLSDNDLDGFIPVEALANLTHLLMLHLQNNLLSSRLPDLTVILLKLVQLNVSNNQLSGRVPDRMLGKFELQSFNLPPLPPSNSYLWHEIVPYFTTTVQRRFVT